MNRKRWAPVAAVAAVLTMLIGVSMLSNNVRAAGPPIIRLAASPGTSADAGNSAVALKGARGSYQLIGTLPNGPLEARVRGLLAGAASVTRVGALAAALGETAAPMRVDGAWKAGDLMVSDEPGNPWTWGARCGPDTPVSSDGGVASDLPASVCANGKIPSSTEYVCADGAGTCPSPGSGSSDSGSSGSGPVAPTPPAVSCMRDAPCSKPTVGSCPSAPSGAEPVACDDTGIPLPVPLPPEKVLLTESQALAATARIRDALGLGGAPTRVEGLSVVVEPLAGGLPTNGMATLLQLSRQAKLVSANGSLSTGRQGDLYPLRSARKAFDDMPVVALGAPCDAAGCPEGPAITGARLGLSRVALDKGAAALVPAWLLTVKGSPVPLVALAVADQFLGGPDPVKTEPGTEPKPTEPGITAPGPDGSVAPPPPATGKPADPQDRNAFGFDGTYADANPKVLVVRYGDSGSCPSQAVRHKVVEQPDRVVVTLTRTPMPADRACTTDYGAKLVRIALTAPLGSREVVDGSRKEPVPVSTGTPPFG